MPSIHRKITLGYYLFAASMIGLAVFAYASLRFLEQRLDRGDAVTAFFDSTLEMRRFEKNYFLYGKVEDIAAARHYAQQALALVQRDTNAFIQLKGASAMQEVLMTLQRYETHMARLHATAPATRPLPELEVEIRELGHWLVDTAEALDAQQRAALRQLLNRARLALVGALVAITLASLFLAHFLSRAVSRPLRTLEQDLQAIGQGSLETLPARSQDREIVRFSEAFNRTLHELEVRRRHLLQSEKLASLGTLVSGVAHELNNPLSNISISTQLLQEDFETAQREQVHTWLADVAEQTDRARRIVATLLDFSRDSAFSLQPTKLRDVVGKTLTLLRSKIPKQGRIEIDIADNVVIEVDAQKLQQVFVNLIGNAFEAGSRLLRIDCVTDAAQLIDPPLQSYVWTRRPSTAEASEQMIFIRVKDDGPGIPSPLLAKVFDPFFTTKDVGQGSGLGLYLAAEIVDQHDGSLGVASAPGQGSNFIIMLPRHHSTKVIT